MMLIEPKKTSQYLGEFKKLSGEIIDEINQTSRYKIIYEDMVWSVQDKTSLSRVKLDFTEFKKIDVTLIELIKIWVLAIFKEYSTRTLTGYLIGLRIFFKAFVSLNSSDFDEFLEKINSLDKSKKTLSEMRRAIQNLIEFYDGYFSDELIEIVYELDGLFMETHDVRKIPPTKDILIFSKILEDYFKSNEVEYFRFKPIDLWWRLTSIIPIRPIEFLKLKKKSFYVENELFYVEIVRVKVNTNLEEKLISKVAISKEVYDSFLEYITKTETEFEFKTEYIFNYQTTTRYNASNKFLENRVIYLADSFNKLIYDFYTRIVFGKYKVPFVEKLSNRFYEISKIIRMGDTRHIAFMNLKRLGYHTSEIANIGGHISVKSQAHYFKHVSNIVDLEILNLIYEIKLEDSDANDEKVDMELIINSLNDISGYKSKVKIGYCIDPKMICKSRQCWYCDSWRITKDELALNKNYISERMKFKSNELEETIQYLGDIYKSIYSENKVTNFEESSNLKTTSRKIDLLIKQFVNLKRSIGDI